MKFVPKGQINNIPALVQIIDCHLVLANKPMLVKFTDAFMDHSAWVGQYSEIQTQWLTFAYGTFKSSSLSEIFLFWIKFHWNVFLGVHFIIWQQLFR